jgi:hypothetical protein
MPFVARSRWVLVTACIAVPAVALVSACSTDNATSPKSVASADTVAMDPNSEVLLDYWINVGSDSGYETSVTGGNGAYVQMFNSGSGSYDDFRLIFQFALPTLAGRGVVDSATMYDYACAHSTPVIDSIVVDHVNWGAIYHDSATWAGQTLQANIGTLARDTTTGWKSLSVTSSIQADYAAKRVNSQFRAEWLYSVIPPNDTYIEFGGSNCGAGGNVGPGYLVIWAH